MADIKFKKTIIEWGNSKAMSIPTELIEFLEIDVGDQVCLIPQEGKKGKFIAIFRE